ncbi:hypothetical protein HDV00_004499 [Rhizophlyctis rosea]|nr:hypothetical protein HDV00_004499 [Rhizophlyctis rosea]
MALMVNVTCLPATNVALTKDTYDTLTTYQLTQNLPDGKNIGTLPFVVINSEMPGTEGGPEVGISAYYDSDDPAGPPYVGPDGQMYVAVYAKNLTTGWSQNFSAVTESETDYTINAATCTLEAWESTADVTLGFQFTDPEPINSIINIANITPTDMRLFSFNQVVLGETTVLLSRLGCAATPCPTVTLPWFDIDFGLLTKIPETLGEGDGHLTTVADVLANLTAVMLSSMTVPSTDTTTYKIYSPNRANAVQIAHACTIVLFLGSTCAITTIILYIAFTSGLSRDRNLRRGMRMTDSVYDFITSVEPSVIKSVSWLGDVGTGSRKMSVRLDEGRGVHADE